MRLGRRKPIAEQVERQVESRVNLALIICGLRTEAEDLGTEIPGARGCTPESCSFRDHHAEIRKSSRAADKG